MRLFDPVQRHRAIEKLVTRKGPKGLERKYYRIRPAKWYGGIVTADCVGCGLLCKFCWVSNTVMLHPAIVGRFYSPLDVAESLVSLAKRRNLRQLRISGGEPTIGKRHLLQLLDTLQGSGLRFILETNGIPIAYDKSYAESLSEYSFIHVRVSLKGCNEEEFAMLTGAKPEGFTLQLEALRILKDANVSCHPSVMTSFSPKKNQSELIQKLNQTSPELTKEVEIEELILYPHVVRRMHQHRLKHFVAHLPQEVPQEQI